MDNFEQALSLVLENEKGFVDNPHDSGGATNAGLSLRFLKQIPVENLKKYGIFKLPNDLTAEDVKELTPAQISLIYRGEFWDKQPYDKIEARSIRNYTFDMCVHHGEGQGIKILQRAICAYYLDLHHTNDDGILGSNTLNNVNACLKSDLEHVLVCERAGYCRLLAAINSKDEEFLNGWLNRCYRI